jgi:hypothetical protein
LAMFSKLDELQRDAEEVFVWSLIPVDEYNLNAWMEHFSERITYEIGKTGLLFIDY